MTQTICHRICATSPLRHRCRSVLVDVPVESGQSALVIPVREGLDASTHRGDRAARMAWMANHLWWVAALLVSVQTGLLYSGLCDNAYSGNGKNGPFGYGAHEGRSNLIDAFLLLGLLGAITLAIVLHNRSDRVLTVTNILIGTLGGGVAAADAVRQIEQNPYCTVGGVWPTVVIASVVLTMAVLVNSGLLRSSSRQ